MALLALVAVLIAGAGATIRWASARPARFVPLVTAAGSAAAFIALRDRYGLEDESFLAALAAFSLLAAVMAAVACAAALRSVRLTTLYTALALVLVPFLFCASIVLRLGMCFVTGCGGYS